LSLSKVNAQTGYKGFSLLMGVSTNQNVFGTIIVENENTKKISVAGSLEMSRYLMTNATDSFGSYDTYLSAGLLLSGQLSYSRNYSARVFIGGMAGTDNRFFIMYPVIGFRQNINLSPNFSLLIQERAAYVFYLPQFNWQATFQIGGRFIF
jgi:hypothetical protein